MDDPYDFGRITAANALSDIYAMGGRPITAMNLLAFPCSLGPEVVAEVLRGGADVCREAGALVVGGHTIDDVEPKFGLSVLGLAHPEKVVRNAGAKPGDILVLTKPIGTGVIGTAIKRGLETEDSARAVIESMAKLNASAAEAMLEVGVHAATDVTGFGILGHMHEMLEASGCAGEISYGELPLFDRVETYAADGVVPGRTADVIEYAWGFTRWSEGSARTPETETAWRVLCDPQTSGGLLIAVPADKHEALLSELERRGVTGVVVGRAVEGEPGTITVE